MTEYQDPTNGAEVLDAVEAWFRRFICVTDTMDLSLLAVWTVHTHLPAALRTTPRLQLDSALPESGKTTTVEHLGHLCRRAIVIASPPSPALIPRLLEQEIRTVAIDEVDRVLRPDGPATPDLLSIINSGYKVGATRPCLVPVKGGGWEAQEMPTFSPVVLSGNAPILPDDTRSRIIRILLMPDYDNTTEESDWEAIEGDAQELHDRIADFAAHAYESVRGLDVDLPDGCVRRFKEKWKPLKRVAVAAGGRWPAVVDSLIRRDLAEAAAERETGLRSLPPGMVLLTDLQQIWPDHDDLVPTVTLVAQLIAHNPDYWGERSGYGKALTETRMGKLINQAAKVTSKRPGGRGPRGYLRQQLEPVWRKLHIRRVEDPPKHPPVDPVQSANPAIPAQVLDPEGSRDSRDIRLHRVHRDPLPGRCSGCGIDLETDKSRAAGRCAECRLANTETGDKQCETCGEPFTPKKPWGRFCSSKCRYDNHMKKGKTA